MRPRDPSSSQQLTTSQSDADTSTKQRTKDPPELVYAPLPDELRSEPQWSDTSDQATDEGTAGALSITSDIALRIFSELQARDLAAASLTCTTWHRWASQNELWEDLYKNEWTSVGDNIDQLQQLSQQGSWYRLFLVRKALDQRAASLVRLLHIPSREGTNAFELLLDMGYPNIADGLRRMEKKPGPLALGDRYWSSAAAVRLKVRYCAEQLQRIVHTEAPPEEAALVISAALQSRDPYWAREVLDILGAEARRRINELGVTGLEALKVVHTVLFGPLWMDIHFHYQETGYVVSPQQGFGIQLRGAMGDYYNDLNSFIDRVLERRAGIPITLSIIHAAVCARAGIKVQLLNIPGHVISYYGEPGSEEERWIDCFDRGRLFNRDLARDYFEEVTGVDVTHPSFLTPMSTRGVTLRMLHNLLGLYGRQLEPSAEAPLAAVARLMLMVTNPERCDEKNIPEEDYLPMYDQDVVTLITEASSKFQFQQESETYKKRWEEGLKNFAFGRELRMRPIDPPRDGAALPKYKVGQVVGLIQPGGLEHDSECKKLLVAVILSSACPETERHHRLPPINMSRADDGWKKPSLIQTVHEPSIYFQQYRKETVYAALRTEGRFPIAPETIVGQNEVDSLDWDRQKDGDVHRDCGRYFESFDENTGCYVPNSWLRLLNSKMM